MPPLIFFVTATIRLLELKYVAVHRETLSRSFKAKVGICIAMAVAYLALIPTNYLTKSETKFSSWLNLCDKNYLTWLNLIQAAAWSLSAYLIVHEYRRLLQEAVYSNKMFWVLSLVCELICVAALWKIYLQNWFMLTTALTYIGLNGALVTLMVVYKKKIQKLDIIESIQMDTQ